MLNQKMVSKGFLGILIVLVGLGMSPFGPFFSETSQAAPIVIRASHDSVTTSPWHLGMVRFAELVEKKSNGNLKLQIFPPGQLSQSNIRTTIEMTQGGSIQCALFSTDFYQPFDKRFMIFGAPFLFADRAKTYRVLDGPVGKKILDFFEEKGVKGLAYWDHGYRQITNSKRPIKKPEDIKGLKIRTPLGPLKAEIFKALGAPTSPIAMGELYMALQQKLVDGQENPFNTIYRRNFYEVQKYITEWNFEYGPLLIVMNLPFFKSLSPENQKILISAAQETAPYQRNLSASEDEEMKQKLVAAGMELTVLKEEELAAFKKAVDPAYVYLEKEIGKELPQEFRNALK
jgi:TRAP-type transport system periplasmic protein